MMILWSESQKEMGDRYFSQVNDHAEKNFGRERSRKLFSEQ